MIFTLAAVVFALSNLAFAQFNFFGNMFQGQQQQQQHRSTASQWAAYSDSVSCSQYVCPETLDCVAKPVDCPCPNPEDIKCIVPDIGSTGKHEGDGTVICTRGGNDCSEIERLMNIGGQHKKK
ncbi:hypothetical protein CPB83DRAFT_213354 [Crepidotus variabilis]|uniref:Long chronological lifespan protein 2 n=1 Tax=Crepidotus variabilis TaxID=179855 RepID=A0A9P6JVQ9_9AGAR|nr:hypothetical protein CPB83DRAFT_213354 [Crepidotus variabilis]